MDIRSMLNQVKSAFVIGKGNPFLHGRQGQSPDDQGYGAEPDYAAPQPPYQQGYPQGYGQPAYQPPHQQMAEPYQQPYQQQPYQQQPQQAPWQQPQQVYQQPPAQQAYPQQAYQQPPQQQAYQQAPEAQQHSFQTQISPEPMREGGRMRRSQQHQEQQQQQQTYQQAPQPPENVVPFPGSHVAAQAQPIDAYVINVFNINTCRQAMSCLRKGQCTLVVMDQLIDKAEIRRFVDMLTGACYALNGTMTRLSSKIGFYIMAPSSMTVYTDPTTSNANAVRPQQQPYRAPGVPGGVPQQRPQGGFSQQSAYAQPPQMTFSASEPQIPQQAAQEYQPPQESYAPYPEQPTLHYQAQ